MAIEEVIISNLLHDSDYAQRVVPFIKVDYFDEPAQRNLVQVILKYVEKYQEPPSREALDVLVDRLTHVSDSQFSDIRKLMQEIVPDPTTNREWLMTETEEFCRTRDLYNSIRTAMEIIEGSNKKFDQGMIPKLLQDSLAITFNDHIGHDFLRDAQLRFDSYHESQSRIPSDISLLNKVIDGGFPRKSLSVFLGTTGAGKSIILGHIGISAWMQGYNVLYISMELSEKELGKRMDANALGIPLQEIRSLSHETYMKRINRLKETCATRFIFQEYPTSSAHVGHFRFLLKELESKQKFKPDLILVDYINICASSRYKGADGNSYTIVKSITEELRGLAVEFDVAMISASQLNRQAYGASDVDLTNTSESMGMVHTADSAFAIISSDELNEANKVIIKQLKNRWGDTNYYNKFAVGMDKSKMRLYNVEDAAQKDIIQTNLGNRKAGGNKNQEEDVPLMDENFGNGKFFFNTKTKNLFNT